MRRRSMLIALVTVFGGSGAVIGSGAFTSVEAQRDVQIQTTGDANALLALQAAGTGTIVDDSGDVIGFDLDNVNRNARTTFRPAMQAENNGSDDVDLYIEEQTDVGDGSVLDFQRSDTQESIVGSSNAVQINSGNTQQLDIEIDLLNEDYATLEAIDNVTIVAEAL